MRTTVTLDPDVELLLRKAMRKRGDSFKQVLNDGLRQGLAGTRAALPAPQPQITFGMGRPLVDLTKATALAAELEDAELLRRLGPAR